MCRPAALGDVKGEESNSNGFFEWTAALWLWPCIVSWPLILNNRYDLLWSRDWYLDDPSRRPRPLGLVLGLLAVAWGQVFVVAYQWARWRGSRMFGPLIRVQPNEDRQYAFMEGIVTHLAQPEGFVLLGLYLSLTWMCGWMPRSYYSFEGGIEWTKVGLCLLCQDALQYAMHRLEHGVNKAFYRASHKAHHRFTNPRFVLHCRPLFVKSCVSGCSTLSTAPSRTPCL